jgi:hypothetical protein
MVCGSRNAAIKNKDEHLYKIALSGLRSASELHFSNIASGRVIALVKVFKQGLSQSLHRLLSMRTVENVNIVHTNCIYC